MHSQSIAGHSAGTPGADLALERVPSGEFASLRRADDVDAAIPGAVPERGHASHPMDDDGTGTVPRQGGVRSRVRTALPRALQALKEPALLVLFWLGLCVWAAFVLGSVWALSASGQPGLWDTHGDPQATRGSLRPVP